MSETLTRTPTMRDLLGPVRIIPVITIDDPCAAVPLARALVAGGLPVVEVTLRTAAGLESISRIRESVLGAVVGAGTVLNPAQLHDAASAGAQFVISPGVTPSLLDAADRYDGILVPGTVSPSEVMAAIERGITEMKFFPAEASGGVPALQALSGPFPRAVFCPTGGITPANVAGYLALDNVMCVGGSWMVPTDLIRAADWDGLRELATAASAATCAR